MTTQEYKLSIEYLDNSVEVSLEDEENKIVSVCSGDTVETAFNDAFYLITKPIEPFDSDWDEDEEGENL